MEDTALGTAVAAAWQNRALKDSGRDQRDECFTTVTKIATVTRLLELLMSKCQP